MAVHRLPYWGSCGNSELYNDYLSALGAKTDYRDDIAGAMCWCPITNLDMGSEGYEWNMGLTRSGLSTADQNISKALAAAFADYINALGLKHPTTGETLTLSATSDGYYQSGSYYTYVMEVINDAVRRYNKYNSASVSTYSTTDAGALSTFAKANKSATKGLGLSTTTPRVARRPATNCSTPTAHSPTSISTSRRLSAHTHRRTKAISTQTLSRLTNSAKTSTPA